MNLNNKNPENQKRFLLERLEYHRKARETLTPEELQAKAAASRERSHKESLREKEFFAARKRKIQPFIDNPHKEGYNDLSSAEKLGVIMAMRKLERSGLYELQVETVATIPGS